MDTHHRSSTKNRLTFKAGSTAEYEAWPQPGSLTAAKAAAKPGSLAAAEAAAMPGPLASAEAAAEAAAMPGPLTAAKVATISATVMLLLTTIAPTALAQDMGLTGKKIVLDAGHGGKDTGARGTGDIHEKDITLAVTKKLAVLLHEGGAQVKLTRYVDDDLATERDRRNRRRQRADLLGRFRITRQFQPDMFISVHCNASTSSSWHGAQTLYMSGNEQGKALATQIQGAFRQQLQNTNRSPAAVKTLFLLKRIHGPAALAEIGFISNPAEERSLKSDVYQDRVALAMYTGVLRYFDDQPNSQSEVAQGGWRGAVHRILG